MSRVPYTSVVGSLMYAMLCTGPNICFTVALFSRCQFNPGPAHWKAVQRIMRYLKGTSDYALCYQSNDLHLKGQTDADYGVDLDDRKSTLGYVFLLSNGAISWSNKKQSFAALVMMKAEFVALSTIAQEVVLKSSNG